MRYRQPALANTSNDFAPSTTRSTKAFLDAMLSEARDSGQVPGERIISLMRRYRVTIRALSQRTGLTMKRVREVRAAGLTDAHSIRDWVAVPLLGSERVRILRTLPNRCRLGP